MGDIQGIQDTNSNKFINLEFSFEPCQTTLFLKEEIKEKISAKSEKNILIAKAGSEERSNFGLKQKTRNTFLPEINKNYKANQKYRRERNPISD